MNCEIINIELKPRKRIKAIYKKPQSVKELERLADLRAREKFPNVPHLAPRLFKDNSANELTKAIVAYINLNGGFASRINSTGVFRPKLGKYIPGSQRKGIADVFGTFEGLSLQIEVKFGRDRQSDKQKEVERDQMKAGGLYFIARNFTEFKDWFDKL